MKVTPKRYQTEAKDSVLEIFRYACRQIDETQDQQSRLAASAYNGSVLIQAPTGAGKTLIAGMVAEEFAKETNIVWFWFTPFAGLVEQARISIKNDFQGLRVRDISCDGLPVGLAAAMSLLQPGHRWRRAVRMPDEYVAMAMNPFHSIIFWSNSGKAASKLAF